MELFIFGAIALAVVFVLYKAYGPKQPEATVSVADVAAKAETVVAEAKPAKKEEAKPAAKKEEAKPAKKEEAKPATKK
mgnify:CR=1 FL=1